VAPARSGAAQLGVRPEHIVFAESGLPVTVERAEYFGADTITACRAGTQRLLVRTPGRPALGAGTTAHLRWPPEAAHLFDATTGLRRDTPLQQLTPDAA
jgi:sn-glycerol 3-phosphate transport system ATP-binding protein